MTDEALTMREVAALLKIGEKTAYTMAQRGERWRFRRVDIDAWIEQRRANVADRVESGKMEE